MGKNCQVGFLFFYFWDFIPNNEISKISRKLNDRKSLAFLFCTTLTSNQFNKCTCIISFVGYFNKVDFFMPLIITTGHFVDYKVHRK